MRTRDRRYVKRFLRTSFTDDSYESVILLSSCVKKNDEYFVDRKDQRVRRLGALRVVQKIKNIGRITKNIGSANRHTKAMTQSEILCCPPTDKIKLGHCYLHGQRCSSFIWMF